MARQPVRRARPARARERIPLPRHPYRDGALFHAALAGLLVLVAWLTGGGLGRALVVGGLYFVVATAWTWFRFRQRIRRDADVDARPTPSDGRGRR